ncbi:hypothetical protein [Vibrio harveyi]|uniref:hypothetical protein n=1 Tax=Vibrio harveyi TaxID=669 RepID=UPI0023806D4D|nr:hypothetical protein [Vibrio harveyi]
MDELSVEMGTDNLAELDLYVAELRSDNSTESQRVESVESEPEIDTSEALDALVSTGLVVVEQAISIMKEIDFAFDERAKQSVIDAARPVAKQYGGALLEQCGDYMNVMTLALAILGLWWASKKQITLLELQKEEEEKRVASRKSD